MFTFLSVSANDVSSNLIGLPDSSSVSTDYVSNFVQSFNDGLLRFVNTLREGVSGIFILVKSIDDTCIKITNLATNHSLPVDNVGDLNLNHYIGNVRFVTGDLVFTEIYVLLMIGAGFFFFEVLMKLFQVLTYLFKSFSNIPFIFNAFKGFENAFRSIFR